jgi:hypothetical protein
VAALGVLAALSVATGAGVAVARGTDRASGVDRTSGVDRASGTARPAGAEKRAATRVLAHPTASRASPRVSAPAGIPSAARFSGSPTIGALLYSRGRNPRMCSAAVIDSPTGNLVATAAHCVDGRRFATNVEYVPDYTDGKAPYGVWPVRAITVASGWQQRHNPDLDLAFLTVAAVRGRQVQAVTGGLSIGFNLGYDQRIEAVAYDDTGSEPVRCATRSFQFRAGQLEFFCSGFSGGTSGAPLVVGYNPGNGAGTLVGVIGGYEDGGRYPWASYSPYFGSALRAAYQLAELRSAAVS